MADNSTKQIKIDLLFGANTSGAKAELNKLQKQLSEIGTLGTSNSGQLSITKQVQEATKAAAELQVYLQNATNVNTGKLNLTDFSYQLKKGNTDLKTLSKSLIAVGPDGYRAFLTLANAIRNAETPLTTTNKLIQKMSNSLKQAVAYQFNNTMIRTFSSAISGAYRYAQDLNESLNNIRIVTGQSTDQMAAFAEKANKAAQALSTTTTQYTDAALIFYQQGLQDKEVEDRTNVTIKMANASRQSAQVVSDQLTAIWNNFAKGGQELEHYADVLTKLGAETASSSAEISQGLEKFAAVADTVGLSYDHAAAALATVTATTRQSADIVGTAFKTLFARIEGLQLGDTLDDGTTLNKYSKALSQVGIQIKDTSGNMKLMDTILDEMGAKWQTLAEDQQIALAQTVAGKQKVLYAYAY